LERTDRIVLPKLAGAVALWYAASNNLRCASLCPLLKTCLQIEDTYFCKKKKKRVDMKQQASLLSFFGQSKNNKKRRLIDHDGNDNDNIHQQQQQEQEQLAAQNALKLQKAEPNITEGKQINKNVSVSNDGKISTVAAIKDDAEEQDNETDTTQSKESDDSSISSDSSSSVKDGSEALDDNDDDNINLSHQKSEYELLRERNIARNNARLKSLGLLIAGTSNNNNDSSKKLRRRSKVVNNKKASSGPAAPSRRSSRLNGVKINYTDEVNSGSTGTSVLMEQSTKNDMMLVQKEEEEEEQFKVSPLFDYQMTNSGTPPQASISTTTSTTTSRTATAAATNNNQNDRIKTLVPSGKRLVPPAGLNAIYSLQFYNSPVDSTSSSSWIVGAGKAGIIALWDLNRTQTQAHDADDDELDYVDPVLSWKGHSGRWIADARFLPSSSSSQNNSIPSRLLTAGNDGTICHWDLSTTSLTTGAPKLLHQTNKSLHSSGIFSMDVKERATTTTPDYLIVTGSKDKQIAVSTLSLLENSNESTVWRSNFHTGKVASVSFSSSTINPLIASASDDGLVAVHDMRANGSSNSSVVVSLDDTHVKPHSAVWRPHSDSTFVTAGLDDVIKLWDLRNTGKPVMSFHGHVPMSGRKLKRIHRPTFFCSNNSNSSESFILSGGENSHAISMFEVDQENVDLYSIEPSLLRSVFSRGKLPDGSGDVGSMAVNSDQVAVTVEGGEVLILQPKS
jgi:WD40 repeat protein